MWLQLAARSRFAPALLSLALLVMPRHARAGGNLTERVGTSVSGYQDTVSVSVLTPSLTGSIESPTAGWGVRGSYLVDVVSAASPDIVTTASPNFVEVRHAGSVGFNAKPKNTGVAGNAAISSTPDYLSMSGGLQLLQDFDEKNWALAAGYSLGHDTVGRTGTSFSTYSHTFMTHAPGASISRVLSSSTLLSFSLDGVFERGDQSKPYRYVPLFAPSVAATMQKGADATVVASSRLPSRPLEQLPLERDRVALTTRLLTRPSSYSFRLEERLYTDSWQLHASTTDIRVLFDVSPRVTLWPHLHAHAQSGVVFWKRAYASNGPTDLPLYRTGDRELGPLLTGGFGGGLRWAAGPAGETDAWVFTWTTDAFATLFLDALYVERRIAGITTLGVEAKF